MKTFTLILASVIACALGVAANAQNITLSNSKFSIVVNRTSGAITSLRLPGDIFPTDYIMSGRTVGDINVRYKVGTGSWLQANTTSSADNRVVTTPTANTAKVSYTTNSTNSIGIKAFTLEETYDLQGEYLLWTMRFKNRGTQTLELGDIGLPLSYNTDYETDAATVYTMRLMRHSFISGDGSFVYLQRNSGEPPYLVMTPGQGTHLEYFIQRADSDPWQAFIHAKYRATVVDTTGTWRQPITSRVLSAAGTVGDECSYTFKFRWAGSYNGVRDTLVQEGLVDVQSVPGMSVPQNSVTTVSLTSMQTINSITPEFPADTTVTFVGKRNSYTYIYQVTFNKIGENLLTVDFGNSRKLYLEYFCTQPTETLIKKRANFITTKQQHKDDTKWYHGLYSVWDMQAKVLRGPDNTGGLWNYIVGGSDDPTNCKAPYVALKNVSYPVQSEVDSCEYYAEHFLWGGLQRTDTETPYPYGIYGIDNWYVNRNSSYGFGSFGAGQEHLWRCYDYPTIFYFYYNMYKIAKYYPSMTHYLNKNGYLERAFGTAKAYFEVPYAIMFSNGGYWGGAYQLGLYHEQSIPDFINDLVAEGRTDYANYLRGEWEKKVKFFCYDDPYPYTSEYSFDSTGFETAHAAARYGLENTMLPDQNLWQDKNTLQWYSHPSIQKEDFANLMERETAANISDRGWVEPSYHQLGSDTRGFGNISYMLSYESQMAGNCVLDYALYYSDQPEEYLKLGYASYLSSWSLINAGDASSNYGYWFPGIENDGAAGWGFEPQKVGRPWNQVTQGRGCWTYDGEIDHGFMGGLRCSATIAVNDPLFGTFAYGGTMAKTGDITTIVPKDALRQRFHMLNVCPKLHMELSRDGFNSVQATTMADGMISKLVLSLENRSGFAHQTNLAVLGLPTGYYTVTVNTAVTTVQVNSATLANITLPIPLGSACTATIELTNTLNGTITNASGTPIANAAVQLGGFGGPAMITGADGKYILHIPSPGIQVLYADALGYKASSMVVNLSSLAGKQQNIVLTTSNETGGIINGSFEQPDNGGAATANGWQLVSATTGTDFQGVAWPPISSDMYIAQRDTAQNQTPSGAACGLIQIGNPHPNPGTLSECLFGASGVTTGLTSTTATTTGVAWTANAWAGYDLVLEKTTAPTAKRRYKIASNTATSVTIASGNMLADGLATGCKYRIVKHNYMNYYQCWLSQMIEVDPDSKYNFYFKGDATATAGAFWHLKWTDIQHNEIGTWTDALSNGPWLSTPGWNQYLRGNYQQGTIKMSGPMLQMTPPAGAKYLEVAYGFSDDTAANRTGEIRVDDVVIDKIEPTKINTLKSLPNGTAVSLTSKVVTLAPRSSDGTRCTTYFFIQEPDRTSGIRVEKGTIQDNLHEDDLVTITGGILTAANGEKYIRLTANPIAFTGTQAKPMLVTTKSIKTDKLIPGQLIKIAAKIIDHAADGKSLIIADGYTTSGQEALTTVIIDGAPLAANEMPAGSMAEITGVVSTSGINIPAAKSVILMKR